MAAASLLKCSVIWWLCSLLPACETPEERAIDARPKKTQQHHHLVQIRAMMFEPSSLDLAAGDTVTWINRDVFEHNVTEEAANLWASPNLPLGTSWSMVVRETSTYYCTLHPSMRANLNVNKQ